MANAQKKYKFQTKFRGYEPKAVHNAISELSSQIGSLSERNEIMQREIQQLKEENNILSRQVKLAERTNEDIARLALKEASNLIEKAKRNANLILKESLDYVRTLSGEVEGFKEQAASIRTSVRKMSQDLLDTIDNSEVYFLINEDRAMNQQSNAFEYPEEEKH